MKTRSLGLITVPVTLMMLSCGDAAGPPAEGAASFSIHPSSDADSGYGCDISTTVLLGAEAPSMSSQGATWVDGQESHDVTCTVSGGDKYSFRGEIRGNSKRFSISGEVTKGASGTANVSLFEPGVAMSLGDSACEVTASGNYLVEKGAVWAGFNCSRLISPDDRYTWCTAQGSFVFKSCDK